MTQRISADAYNALCEALAVTTWYRTEFKRMVHALLREHPELLGALDFEQTKRIVAGELISLLMAKERLYQDLTLQLMIELASKTHFPDIERTEEPKRTELLKAARNAVARLNDLVGAHKALLEEQEKIQDQVQHRRSAAARNQSHTQALAALKARFLKLREGNMEAQARGRAFERFLHDLFALFDLEPRLGYKLGSEQIDGSFRLATDDYILEAKWTQGLSTRPDADLFAAKVQTKGKNALGLFVSFTGFTEDFLERFRERTPFVTIDGSDLYLILDDRVRLDDALLAKKRWANDTGSCHRPLAHILQI